VCLCVVCVVRLFCFVFKFWPEPTAFVPLERVFRFHPTEQSVSRTFSLHLISYQNNWAEFLGKHTFRSERQMSFLCTTVRPICRFIVSKRVQVYHMQSYGNKWGFACNFFFTLDNTSHVLTSEWCKLRSCKSYRDVPHDQAERPAACASCRTKFMTDWTVLMYDNCLISNGCWILLPFS